MSAPRGFVITGSVFASLGAFVVLASALADSPVPIEAAGHRSTDGQRIEATAVGLPDWRFPTIEARCVSGREAGFRRAKTALHDYVDHALRESNVTPEGLVRAHETVDGTVQVLDARGLVDCGSIVTVAVGVSALERAVLGAEVRWP